MATLERKYLYKISRNGIFLGVLQNVTNDFHYSQLINTAGTSINIDVAMSVDNSHDAIEAIETENGLPIETEDGLSLEIERQPDLVGSANSNALINNDNDILIYEVSDNNVSGKLVFSGYMSKWKATFGGSNNVSVTCLSYGTELDNYIIQGANTLDVSQTTSNSSTIPILSEPPAIGDLEWSRYGQTFIPTGANLASIVLRVAAYSSSSAETITVKLWSNTSDYYGGGTPLGTVTQLISSTTLADHTFTFATPSIVAPGVSHFFSVVTAANASDGHGAILGYQNTNVYADGAMQQSFYGGGGGGAWVDYGGGTNDLYFKTYYTAGATSSPFTSQDPTAILRTLIDNYVSQGGTINYASGTTVLTGTSAGYTFKINTVLEGIKKCLDLAPYDWYWYVDPATSTLYFKQTPTVATHTMYLGRHIKTLELEATIEGIKNIIYFSGGPTAGVNLFIKITATASVLASQRAGIARLADNRVELTATATTLATSYLNENASEKYITQIQISADTYDISLFNLGDTVGFATSGNFVDTLLLQIVGVKRFPDSATLSLGLLPQRATGVIAEIQRGLAAEQTVANPSIPS